MPNKKIVYAHKSAPNRERVPTNLTLNEGIKTRGAAAAQRLGYNLSTVTDAFLEKLHEALYNNPRRKRDDPLQIQLFPRNITRKKHHE